MYSLLWYTVYIKLVGKVWWQQCSINRAVWVHPPIFCVFLTLFVLTVLFSVCKRYIPHLLEQYAHVLSTLSFWSILQLDTQTVTIQSKNVIWGSAWMIRPAATHRVPDTHHYISLNLSWPVCCHHSWFFAFSSGLLQCLLQIIHSSELQITIKQCFLYVSLPYL